MVGQISLVYTACQHLPRSMTAAQGVDDPGATIFMTNAAPTYALHDPALAHGALARYGLAPVRLDLLNNVRHVTYHVQTDDGRRYTLRITPASEQAARLLHDEVAWLDFVTSYDVAVPAPIRNRAGALVTPVDPHPYLACLFTWLEGQPATTGLAPSALYDLGHTIATLHRASRAFPLPTDRPFRTGFTYDARLVVDHRTWLAQPHAARSAAQSAIVDTAITYAMDAFTHMANDPAHAGLIHADIHLGNLILAGDRVALIDFEQLGWGPFAYDLAVLHADLTYHAPATAQHWPALLAGYQSVAPLPYDTAADFAALLAAVHLAFLDWVYNAESPTVWQQQSPRIPAVYAALTAILHAAAGWPAAAWTKNPG